MDRTCKMYENKKIEQKGSMPYTDKMPIYTCLVAQNLVDLLHKPIVLAIWLDRIQTHSNPASLRLNISHLCSVRELRLTKTTGEVWRRYALQESIALLSDILLFYVSLTFKYVSFRRSSYRVVRGQWN